MTSKDAYIVVDFGTGNLRVAIVSVEGAVLAASREDIVYHRDTLYEESIYFKPDETWRRIVALCNEALGSVSGVDIQGVTATSQREGVVILDTNGSPILGMPNIDHRGRKWESSVGNKDRVYELTGRYPTSLFSALKIKGLTEVYPDIQIGKVLSISDWVEYMFSGVAHYEHSQASETLWYDVAAREWSKELIEHFGLDPSVLPPLVDSASVLGDITQEVASLLGISNQAKIIVGGADTQLAVVSTHAGEGDLVIVSGTTTPIVKLTDRYVTDAQQRTWTGQHVEAGRFMLEANAGVTGLNYQRLKKIFYPHESYDEIEQELAAVEPGRTMAALGSLLADEKAPLLTGGFIFRVPVSHELCRADFVWATLWDIACSIFENYLSLCSVDSYARNYLWTCGGGMESKTLRTFIASLTGKEIRIRSNFQHASAVGGAILCNRALKNNIGIEADTDRVQPDPNREQFVQLYEQWKQNRTVLKQGFK
jgi:autoinducer 2 (AI-2) kinase